MDIKAKEKELFYLSCVVCEAISNFEESIKKSIDLKERLLYDAHFQLLLSLRDKLSLNIMEVKIEPENCFALKSLSIQGTI